MFWHFILSRILLIEICYLHISKFLTINVFLSFYIFACLCSLYQGNDVENGLYQAVKHFSEKSLYNRVYLDKIKTTMIIYPFFRIRRSGCIASDADGS